MSIESDRPTVSEQELRCLVADFIAAHPIGSAPDRELRAARFYAGLAFVAFDRGCGGLGATNHLQTMVDELFLNAGYEDWTARNLIGLGHAAQTVYHHGTAAQRAKYLKPLFIGDEIWCQLFSEPGAGSDLASLATRAVRVGDSYVINGQKVWTSLAHVARRGLLLARTDPSVPKHRGLSYFVLDMHLAGVDVRPLRQITGESEFNEVYLSDVCVPVADRLGEEGDGWRVAITTLMNERSSIGRQASQPGDGTISRAVAAFEHAVVEGTAAPGSRDELMRLWVDAEVARLTAARAERSQFDGKPGAESSVAKLAYSELNKRVLEYAVNLLGADALLIGDYEEVRPSTFSDSSGLADVRKAWLRSIANSIEGGTSDIMRNILGERVLGLPAEARTDRDLPWQDIRRS